MPTSGGGGAFFGRWAQTPQAYQGTAKAATAPTPTLRHRQKGNELERESPWTLGLRAPGAEVSFLAPPRPRACGQLPPQLPLGRPPRPGRELPRGRVPGGRSQGLPGQTGVPPGQLGRIPAKQPAPPVASDLCCPGKSGLGGAGRILLAERIDTPRSRQGHPRAGRGPAGCYFVLSDSPISPPWVKPQRAPLGAVIMNPRNPMTW